MSGLSTHIRSWARRPLSADEWGEATQVAVRLKSELAVLIALLPEHARHASGMSRHLGVLRVTCQRVVQAVAGEPSPLMLVRLPGVEGLRQFVEGFLRVGIEKANVDLAMSAVEAFERLIEATGGSQTKLAERVQLNLASGAGGGGGGGGGERSDGAESAASGEEGLATLDDRHALYQSATRITGRSCDVALSIYAFAPCESDTSLLERALAKGLIGSTLTPGGMPMVLSSGDTVHGEEEARRITLLRGQSALGRTPEAILKPFSTDPLPMVTSRGRGGTLFQVIDPAVAHKGEPIDVVTALRGQHPMFDPDTGKPTLDAVWSLVTCPSRRLILDVYLHAGLERKYRPSIEALLWTASIEIGEDQKWAMRLPAQPRLQLLGRGIANAASPLWPRHAELTSYFFDHIGWDDHDFIGFRCEVEYPIWRAGYCMGFEYLG